MRSILPTSLLILLSAAGLTRGAEAPPFATALPFRDCRGLICLDISLDGAPHTLLLDTGNVNSTVATDVATSLRWKLEPIVRDGKKVAGMQRGGAHTARLGKLTADTGFIVLDRALFGPDPPPADGTLAYTFFKDRILQIDYPHHVVRVSDVIETAQYSAGPGELKLITFGSSGPPIVVGSPFTINGASVQAQIDTCYTGTMLVYDAAIDRLGLRDLVSKGKPEYFPDTDSGVTMLAAPIRSIGFGKLTPIFDNAKVYFPGDSKNPVHQPDGMFQATVGNAFFKNRVLTLDFHTMTLNVQQANAVSHPIAAVKAS